MNMSWASARSERSRSRSRSRSGARTQEWDDALREIKRDRSMLRASKFKDDRQFVFLAVQQNGLALQHADSSLQADRRIVLAAVQENGGALKYVDASLKCDREIVLAAVQNENCYLSECSEGVGHSIQLFPVQPLTFCDRRLLGDREIVLAAMQTGYKYWDGPAFGLHSFNDTLRADSEVVLAAVRKCWRNLHHASHVLRSQRDIVCEAVVQHPCGLWACPDSMLCDEILRAAEVQASVDQPPFGFYSPGTDEGDRLRDVARAHLHPVVIQVGSPEQVTDNIYRFQLMTLGGTRKEVEVTRNLTNTTTTEALRRPAAAVFPLSGPVDFEDPHNTAAAGRRFNFVLTSGVIGKVGCEVALGIN